jgi:tRNA(Arg) A34 adenosine deaminase TadA
MVLPTDEWGDLPAPWPEVFSLMWEAYVAGTIPVGAVVVDEAGQVVSRGRNRIFDDSRDGHLGRSRLAHAELNALVALTSDRIYEDFTLYSALEPCHLCLSAALSVQIGSLRYGGRDPYSGAVGKLVPSAAHEAHRPLKIEGPLSGAPGRLPELLHVAHFLWRVPSANVMSFYRRTRPDLVATAQTLPPPDSGATLTEAFAALNS